MTIWIIYTHSANGERFALAAYDTHLAARRHVTRCTRTGSDDAGDELLSAAELLGVTLSIQRLEVTTEESTP